MKIPIITAQTDIPSQVPVTVRTNTAGEEWGAVGEFGRTLEAAALRVAEEDRALAVRKKRVDIANTTINTEIAVSSANEDVITELRKNPNPDTYYYDWNKRMLENVKKNTEGIQDPETRARAEIAAKHIMLRESVQQKNYANHLWLNTKQAEMLRQNDYFVEAGNTEGAYTNLERNINSGVLDPKAAELERQRIRDKQKVVEERVKRETEAAREKASETKADVVLSQKYGKDYDKMISDLEDPKEYEALGLTVQSANNLKSIISNRATKEDKEKKATWDATNQNFTKLDANDSLSMDMVREALELNSIDPKVAHAWQVRIETKIDQGGKIKTDPAVYNRLNTLAWEHPDKEFVKGEILKNIPYLEESDVEKLLGKNQEKGNTVENKARSDARERIEKTIFPRVGMMEKVLSTPISEQRLSDAYRALDNAIGEAKAKGKPLTTQEIDKLGIDISQRFTTTYQQKMKEFNDYITGKVSETKEKEEYVIGDIYEDKNRKKAKYLGKGKWQIQ